MSIAKRESLGPAVGAEDCDDEHRIPEGENEAKEEIFESEISPEMEDIDVDDWAPERGAEARDNRESLFQLLGDMDSLSRLQVTSDGACGQNADDSTEENFERQADLELAAKIGQALVQKNEALQQELNMSRQQQVDLEDNMQQLAHELGQKEELLRQMGREWREQEMAVLHPRFWDAGDTESESGSGQLRHTSSTPSLCSDDAEVLQEECRQLNHSNAELLEESLQLRVQSLQVEKRESNLISECVQKLGGNDKEEKLCSVCDVSVFVTIADADDRIAWLIQESDEKADEARRHDEEARRLKNHLDELQSRSKQFVRSDEELRQQLLKAYEKELELQTQVSEWQKKYVECHEMLQVAQEEVRFWREQNAVSSGPVTMSPSGTVHRPLVQPSLDDEIQNTIEHELFSGEPLSQASHAESRVVTSTPQKQFTGVTRVMETVKAVASRALNLEELPGGLSIQDDEIATPHVSFHDTSLDSGVESEPLKALGLVAVGESTVIPVDQWDLNGTLEVSRSSADERLGGSVTQQSGKTVAPEIQLQTVDRVQVYSAPEKLQIVKPLEGSRTLGKWQELASTGSAGLGQPALKLPGIQVKQREQQKMSELGERTEMKTKRQGRKAGLGMNLETNDMPTGVVRRVSVDPCHEEPEAVKKDKKKDRPFPSGFQPFTYLSSLLNRPPGPGHPLLSRKQSVGLARLLASPFVGGQALVERRDSHESIE